MSIHTSSGDEGNIESNHKESTGLSWKLTGESSSKSSPSSDSDSEPIKVPTKKKRKQSKLNEKKEAKKIKTSSNNEDSTGMTSSDSDLEDPSKSKHRLGMTEDENQNLIDPESKTINTDSIQKSSFGSEDENKNTRKSEEQDIIKESNDKIAEKKSDKPVKNKQPSILTMFAKSKSKSKSKEALGNNKIIPGENSLQEDHMDDDVGCEKSNKIVKPKKIKKRKRKCVVRSEWFQPNDVFKDNNGDVVNSYLRRVPGNKYLVSCYLCSLSVSVEYKGFSAIQDHANSNKHQKRRREDIENDNIGKYVEKKREDSVIDAEIKLAKFAGIHNVSLKTTLPHLVKLLKAIFPDSPICQEMSSLSASRLYYGLKEGIGNTEIDLTVKDLVDTPFSLQMDVGMKGGKHRINFIVRYYSEDIGKTTVNETV